MSVWVFYVMQNNKELQIGRRLYLIRNLLLLTKIDIKNFVGISETTLGRIENGILPLNRLKIELLSKFYGISDHDLLNLDKPIPSWKSLKRKVLSLHRNNEKLLQALEKKPNPRFAIEYRILKSDFFNNFHNARQTMDHLKNTYNWSFPHSSIKNSLDKLFEDGKLEIKSPKLIPQEFRAIRTFSSDQEEIIMQIKRNLEENTPNSITDLVSPAFDRMAKMLVFLRNGAQKRSSIFLNADLENATNNIRRSLKVLENLDLVEMTIKDEPNSSKQQYRLTREGVELVNKFVVVQEK